jgi:hypothetical protein
MREVVVKLVRILRNGIAGALIAALPVTATMGATRPNAAVPTASSAAVTASYQDGEDGGISWIAIAAIGVAVAVALWLILDNDDDDEGSLSEA